jgi:hypothetical protein
MSPEVTNDNEISPEAIAAYVPEEELQNGTN